MKKKIHRKLSYWAFKASDKINEKFGIKELDYPHHQLLLSVENLREYDTRSNSCRKEPETVEWIEKYAPSCKVMYDIGANVGAYSLLGAAHGLQVLAFEPAYQNFYKLQLNITLNKLDHKIGAYPLAFSTETKVANFKYIDDSPGSSKCYYNENDLYHLKNQAVTVEKPTLIFELDNFVEFFRVPLPDLIKLDVDGAELDVLKGAKGLLKTKQLKSLLVEVDHNLVEAKHLIEIISTSGLRLDNKFERSHNTFNYIFVRD